MKFNKNDQLEKILQLDILKKERPRRYLELITGVFLLAIAFNLFMFPNKIVLNFSGIAIIINNFLGIEPSIIIFVLTVLLLVIGYFTIGPKKIKNTIIGALGYPLLVELTKPLTNYIVIDNSDGLLSVIFGSFIYGIGQGLVFRAGFSTGGSDTVMQILNKYFKISLGKANMVLNLIIISLGVFTFGITRLMYSLVFLYILSAVMDKVILGISNAKAFYIITDYDKEIKTYITRKLGRGVTVIEARGGFTNNKEKLLMCIIPTREYFILKDAINEIDKDAVLLITDVYESKGSR